MTVNLQTRYGSMACLEADNIVSRSLIVYGEWAQLEIDMICKLVRTGDTVADVGAFLGTHTLALAQMVGAHGRVHSFEPRRYIREILDANVNSNGLEQVEIHPFALGRTASTIDIAAIDPSSQQNFGGLALDEVPFASNASIESISIRKFDDIDFPRMDFLKIDAEGMEAEVVMGARRTIEKHRPLVFAECNDLKHGASLLSAFDEAGYHVFGAVTPAFNPDNFRRIQENFFGKAAEVVLIAIPPDKVSAALCAVGSHSLMPIDSLDALSALLLHKPQYLEEILLSGAGGLFLRERSDGEFGVPGMAGLIPTLTMHDSLVQSVAELHAESQVLSLNLKAALQERQSEEETVAVLTGLRAQSDVLTRDLEAKRQECKELKKNATILTRYRRTSLLRLWEKLWRKQVAPSNS
jgi:FkbM family methyltransferase